MDQKTYLANIYKRLKGIGLVKTQAELSNLCGRRGTYISSIKRSGFPITTDAALSLSINLRNHAISCATQHQCDEALMLSEELEAIARNRALSRKYQRTCDA